MSEPANLIPSGAPELATPVPSPCVSLCKMDADRLYCMGCMRTIPEIIAWSNADDDYKRGVWAEIRRREQLINFDDE
ncbi:MAG: DUF1289 domain-containing protein [Pseudomonadota bacterium]